MGFRGYSQDIGENKKVSYLREGMRVVLRIGGMVWNLGPGCAIIKVIESDYPASNYKNIKNASWKTDSPSQKPPLASRPIVGRAATKEVSGSTEPTARLIGLHRGPAILDAGQIQTLPDPPPKTQPHQTEPLPIQKLQILPVNPIIALPPEAAHPHPIDPHHLQPNRRSEQERTQRRAQIVLRF